MGDRMKKGMKVNRFLMLAVLMMVGMLMMTSCGKKNEEEVTSKEDTVNVEEQETTEADTDETEALDAEDAAGATEAEDAAEEDAIEVEVTEEPEELIPEEPELIGTGKMVAIDAGHQGKGNHEQEPIGPGASETKPKVASGTTGRTTGVPEYVLNLDVAMKLKEELLERGYEVYMIRETHDIDISNSERAKVAADAGADILVRIHANGSDNTSVAGALTMAPSTSNRFLSADLITECQELSADIIETYCAATGANNQGIYQTDTMSGLNWCTIPATIVELGYMTNPEEDTKMQTEEYQELMVQGIANGIDQYFASK